MVKLYIKIQKKIKKWRDDLMSNRKIQNGSIVYMYIFMKSSELTRLKFLDWKIEHDIFMDHVVLLEHISNTPLLH